MDRNNSEEDEKVLDLDAELSQDGQESSDSDEPVTYDIEQIINKIIGDSVSVRYLIIAVQMIVPLIAVPILAVIPVFTGFIPYTEWHCTSPRCYQLLDNQTSSDADFYTQTTICQNSLEPGVDIAWNTTRTSYAIDWNLICSNEHKVSNLQSFFFLGAFVGVFPASLLLDTFGRRGVMLGGIIVAAAATLGNVFVHSYTVMLPLRVLQGLSSFLIQTAVQAIAMEFTPTKLRNLASIMTIFSFSMGLYVGIGLSFILHTWRNIFFACFVAIALTGIPALLLPESPRFHLIKGNEIGAKRTFGRLANFFKSPLDLSKVKLQYTHYDQNFLTQMSDFVKYPRMTKNTIMMMLVYLCLSSQSYSLTYGWTKLGADAYTSIAISSLGNVIAVFTGYQFFITEKLGRRRALIANTFLISAFVLLAIPQVKISNTVTLSEIMCLISTPFNSCCWTGAYLLVAELTPTSHRGTVMALNLATARAGSFIGPYMALLFNVLDNRLVMLIIGAVTTVSIGFILLSDDTTGKPIPATPAEVGAPRGAEGKREEVVSEDGEDDKKPLLQ